MELRFREYGQGEPLVILHGLFGSSANWNGIARQLAETQRVLVPDLRNHGGSPHRAGMSYPELAGDLLAWMDRQDLGSAWLMGHSMGGKLAMWLALHHPERVARLVVVDIAPVAYGHDFRPFIHAMRAVEQVGVRSRAEAESRLTPVVPDPAVRQFLLQNLVAADGRYRWRINLDALEAGMPDIVGFPEPDATTAYTAPALFVHGARSDYLGAEALPVIAKWFPAAEVIRIADAGHWLHVEQPRALLDALNRFAA